MDKLLYHFQPSPFAIELDSRTFSSSLDIIGTPFKYDTAIILISITYNKIFPYLPITNYSIKFFLNAFHKFLPSGYFQLILLLQYTSSFQ